MSDPTDPGGVTRRPTRARSSRVGDAGSPLATPVTIALAVILVIGGALILRSVRDDSTFAVGTSQNPTGNDDPAPLGGEPVETQPPGSGVENPVPTDPPPAGPTRTGAIVQVANASRVQGSAGTMTSTLAAAGYLTAAATDVNRAIVGEEALEQSRIHYVGTDAAAQAVAQQLAVDLGMSAESVTEMPDPVPTSSGTLGTATVLLVLGRGQVEATIAPAGGSGAAADASGGQSLLPPVPGSPGS